jgi:molybdopterin synthase sulfur carrier subunit
LGFGVTPQASDIQRGEEMSVTVRIPTPLRSLTGGQGEVQAAAASVRELIDALEGKYQGLRDRLCDEQGQLRRFINVYVNEEDIRFLQGPQTPLKAGDQVSIVPAIAGGAGEGAGFPATAGGCPRP